MGHGCPSGHCQRLCGWVVLALTRGSVQAVAQGCAAAADMGPGTAVAPLHLKVRWWVAGRCAAAGEGR